MEDVESLPEYQALVIAAAGKPERSMGSSVIPAEPPKWKEVANLVGQLQKVAPDELAVHVYAVLASTHLSGFHGLDRTLGEMYLLLQNSWDTLAPTPDLDDPEDMYYARINLVQELSERPEFIDAIYHLPLVKVRGIGEFSLRDIDIGNGGIVGTEDEVARCQIGLVRGAFAESPSVDLQKLQTTLNSIMVKCLSIETLFSEQTAQIGVLSLKRLHDRISTIYSRFLEYAEPYMQAEEEPPVEVVNNNVAVPDVEGSAASLTTTQESTLTDRAMVLDAFSALVHYYQRHEPSSPVLLLVEQARCFVEKPFFESLQALAPHCKGDLANLLSELSRQPLAAMLNDCYQRFLGGEANPVSPLVERENTDSADSLGNSHVDVVIASRDEVLQTLQNIEVYFVQREPASPIPLIIADIRSLVGRSYTEMLAELSRLLPPSEGSTKES